MGCDGGTIPRRDELVRTKKKPEQKDKAGDMNFKWKHCALSHDYLQPPIVACELGRMYNKDKILDMLLEKPATSSSDIAGHITSIKHVRELNLTVNPALSKRIILNRSDVFIDNGPELYICPIVGIEMNGKFKFCFIWSCGCVLSERAFKEVKSNICLKCQKPYKDEDIITLNPTEDVQVVLAERMVERRSKRKHDAKKAKTVVSSDGGGGESSSTKLDDGNVDVGTSKRTSAAVAANGEVSDLSQPSSDGCSAAKKKKSDDPICSSGKTSVQPSVNNHSSTIAKSKIVAAAKIIKNTNPGTSGPSSSKLGPSEAYKSLFTTSKSAQNQAKAHWVTYNPFYN